MFFSGLIIVFVSLTLVRQAFGITFEDVQHNFDTLQTWYNSSIGLWIPSTGWWNSANCMDMLARLAAIDDTIETQTAALWSEIFTNAPTYNALMTNSIGPTWKRAVTISARKKRESDVEGSDVGFLNGFYDDEGWWALAWMSVYDLTRNDTYLNEAAKIFDDMHAAWGSTPVGGLWWSKERTYVNAITNELHLSVAAHLANRYTENSTYYLSIAQDSWNWFYTSGMINSAGNVVDGILAIDSTGLNLPVVWSYNQGVILGGLLELARAASQPLYVDIAKAFADAAIANLTSMNDPVSPNLILHDVCESATDPGAACGNDGASFKGIFARYLSDLNAIFPQDLYGEFLVQNTDSLWQFGRDQFNRLSLRWDGPMTQPAGGSPQCSGMDLFVGALKNFGEWEGNATYQSIQAKKQDRNSAISTTSSVMPGPASQISPSSTGLQRATTTGSSISGRHELERWTFAIGLLTPLAVGFVIL